MKIICQRECTLNFNQWQTFSENYKPIRVSLWIVYQITENNCRSRLFTNLKLSRGILLSCQNKHSKLNTICHIKPKFFLWNKLLENVLLAKYFISVNAVFKGIVMKIEKAIINDRLRVSKVWWKFRIPTVYNFAVIYLWNLLFS